MGQCFSTSNAPLASGFDHYYQNPAPHAQQPPAEFSIPPAMAQAFASGPDPLQDMPRRPVSPKEKQPEPALNLKNRFIDTLCENKNQYPIEQQQAIDRLKTYDELKHRGLKNRDLMPTHYLTAASDKASRQALKRTASFRLIEGILVDVAENTEAVQRQRGTEKVFTQVLLTAEMEAVKHQIAIGENEVLQKIRRGERLSPMLMDKAKFGRFLRNEDHSIREIIQICRTFGEARNQRLTTALTKLSQSYLRSTNTLPSGLKPDQFTEIGPIRITEPLGVHVTPGFCAVSVYKEDNSKTAAIVIDPKDVTTPTDDPADGNQDDQCHALGFEHCDIPEKQAAYFLQLMFSVLPHIELTVAEEKGCRPGATVQEARTAAYSQADREYGGALQVGDRCDKTDINPEEQRRQTVAAAKECRNVALSFPIFNGGEPLFVDPEIESWVQSPLFDLEGLRHPEFRALGLCAEPVKQALLETRHFAPRRV
jgi:hypothetical protein